MDDKKNIIFFMPFIGGGGVEKNLISISNYFAEKSNKIFVCTSSKKYRYKFHKKIKLIIPFKNLSEKLSKRILYLFCLYSLFIFLMKNKNSVVFSFQANIYCIFLCKLLNIKLVVRSNTSPFGWGHSFIKNIIYKYAIKYADEVITNSLDFKNQMNKKFNIKSKCIYNPLNIKEINKKSLLKKTKYFAKSKKIKLLSIGRFTDQKDHITIIKAAKLLMDEKIPFYLILVGEGENKKKLSQFIINNNLQKDIKIVNFLENPYPIIKEADLFLLSSKYEGLPNVILEAGALKKPIISSNCPTGPKEILLNGKGGHLFKIGNHKELKTHIKKYSENKKAFQKKAIYLYSSLKRFNYKKNLDLYFKILKNLTN